MGYGTRGYFAVIEERLLYWYLFRRKGHIDLNVLAELYKGMQMPVRWKPESKFVRVANANGSIDWAKSKHIELPGAHTNKMCKEQMKALKAQLEQMVKGGI